MSLAKMMFQRFRVVSLCILMGLMVVACSTEGPIVAVTPIVLESAEFGTEATVATLSDPSPADAVSTVIAYPADNEETSSAGDDAYPADNEAVSTATPVVVATVALDLSSSYEEPVEAAPEAVAGQIVEEDSRAGTFEEEPTLVPIPVMERVPRGLALNAAREADRASGGEPFDPDTSDEAPVVLRFGDFFDDFDIFSTEPPVLSEKLLALDGKTVILEGYMAPPLQLGLDWFMMTRQPLGSCPFHSSTATVTPDILLVYVDGEEFPFSWRPLRVMGELHVGATVDPVTGMASLVRLYAGDSDIRQITWSGQ